MSEANVLTGFNVNIDNIYSLKDIDVDLSDVEASKKDKVEGPDELNSVLKHCIETGDNLEVRGRYLEKEFPGSSRRIGGQGGIIADFLSKTGNYTVLYTPFLSEVLADEIDDDVVYPVMDGGLRLKRVGDAVNTDRTKENMIVEIEEKSCRLIVSDRLEGFGPYFRKGVADNLDVLDEDLDAVILSGFHDADGNFEAKINKAEIQLEAFETPSHLEYVGMDRKKSVKIVEDLLPVFESIGMDETEALQVSKIRDKDFGDELSLGEAFQLGKDLVKNRKLERVHIHTYRYHVVITGNDYSVEPERIRDSMLYAEKCALALAEYGSIPDQDDLDELRLQNVHLHRLDDLEHFQHHLGLENFVETGIAEVEGFNVVAIPTMIHEDPERLVGMGDIISSAAYTAELG